MSRAFLLIVSGFHPERVLPHFSSQEVPVATSSQLHVVLDRFQARWRVSSDIVIRHPSFAKAQRISTRDAQQAQYKDTVGRMRLPSEKLYLSTYP